MKLHLGCGKRYLKGYYHADLTRYPHVDYVGPVEKLPHIECNSVELIYASHVLEYFHPLTVDSVLFEWKRVLQPGGILRLAVPDFSSLAYVYHEYRDIKKILGPLYGHWVSEDVAFQHATVYDHRSLSELLKKNGYVNVEQWDWRKIFVGELEGFDDYSQAYIPHMDKKNGTLISLNLQAKKPLED